MKTSTKAVDAKATNSKKAPVAKMPENKVEAPAVQAQATTAPVKASKGSGVVAEPKVKRVTNQDKAQVIWLEELTKRQAGFYATNKFPNRAFRRVVLDRFVAEVEGKDGFISMASASTIFNKLKEDADALTKDGVNALLSVNGVYSSLGRDPKVVVIKEPKAPKAAKTAPAATEAPATVETAQQEEAVA